MKVYSQSYLIGKRFSATLLIEIYYSHYHTMLTCYGHDCYCIVCCDIVWYVHPMFLDLSFVKTVTMVAPHGMGTTCKLQNLMVSWDLFLLLLR